MNIFFKFFLIGIFSSLLFPPFFLTPLGFIIFPYILFSLSNKNKLLNFFSQFLVGFSYGLGLCSIFLLWIKEPFLLDEINSKYYFFSYLLILYCSIYFGFIFLVIKLFKNDFIKLLIFPSVIVLFEFVCANFSYGFPWLSFALINSNNFFGMTIVYYLGSYGLSYLTILIFLTPYLFLIKNKFFLKKIYLVYFSFSLIVFSLIFHNIKYNENENKNLISITIGQLNFPLNHHLSLENKEIKIKKIAKIIRESNSEIIIFAENDYPFLMDKSTIIFFQNLISDNQSIIIGSTRKESSSFYNSMFLINKKNHQKFDKQILVPFGEFVPFRLYFSFMESIAGSFDFARGKDSRVLTLKDNYNILPVICYEIIYFWSLLTKNNSNLIVNITNDSWFGNLLGPYQHFYFTKLRSAEFNKPIIRVSTNGISGIINSKGKILDIIKLNESNIMETNIFKYNVKKNFLNFHKIFFLIIILIILLGLILDKKYEKRKI